MVPKDTLKKEVSLKEESEEYEVDTDDLFDGLTATSD